MPTYIWHTIGTWEHTRPQTLVTFSGQLVENTHIHLSHWWEMGAYTHRQVGHIFGTNFRKYTLACLALLGHWMYVLRKCGNIFYDASIVYETILQNAMKSNTY